MVQPFGRQPRPGGVGQAVEIADHGLRNMTLRQRHISATIGGNQDWRMGQGQVEILGLDVSAPDEGDGGP